jgi:hypothetical protein
LLQDEINLANLVISDRLASEEIAFAYKTRWSTEIVERLESSCPRLMNLGRLFADYLEHPTGLHVIDGPRNGDVVRD